MNTSSPVEPVVGVRGLGQYCISLFFHDNKQTDTVLTGASGEKAQLVNVRGF